jgi:hypothetical protein
MQIPPPGSVSYYPPTSHLTVEVVVANAGDVTASQVHVLATLTPVAAGGTKTTTSGRHRGNSTTTTTAVVSPAFRASSASSEVPSIGAGRSLVLTLPPLSCQDGGRYVLRISVGDDVESFTLQVAEG